MNTDIEREAREAALLSTPMGTRYDEDLCCYDNDSLRDEFVLGYLAAATLREKEIEKLRALLEKLQKDAALYAEYVRRNPPVGMRDETEREIATLRARVEELEGMVPKWADANEAPRLEDLGWLRAYDDKCGDDPRMWLMCMVPPIPVPETKP